MTDVRFQEILSNKKQRHTFSVVGYKRGLTSMLVRVKEIGENKDCQYYEFGNPDYFEGPMGWGGSGFYMASEEEDTRSHES